MFTLVKTQNEVNSFTIVLSFTCIIKYQCQQTVGSFPTVTASLLFDELLDIIIGVTAKFQSTVF